MHVQSFGISNKKYYTLITTCICTCIVLVDVKKKKIAEKKLADERWMFWKIFSTSSFSLKCALFCVLSKMKSIFRCIEKLTTMLPPSSNWIVFHISTTKFSSIAKIFPPKVGDAGFCFRLQMYVLIIHTYMYISIYIINAYYKINLSHMKKFTV